MVLFSELSRRRIRSIQKLIRVGRNEVAVVLRVDKEKGASASSSCSIPSVSQLTKCIFFVSLTGTGYIDLSKRRVSPEDIVKCEERYMKSKAVASIMRHVASKLVGSESGSSAAQADIRVGRGDVEDQDDGGAGQQNEETRLEHLYEQIAWPLGKKYGHPYDAFKIALTCVGGEGTFLDHFSDADLCRWQGTRDRLFVAGDAYTGGHPDSAHVHHRATPHAPADQAACRH